MMKFKPVILFCIIFHSLFFGQTLKESLSDWDTILTYQELENPTPASKDLWDKTVANINYGWGSTNIRYKKETPYNPYKTISLKGWKGEKVAAQFLISNNGENFNLSFGVSPLSHSIDRKNIISANQVESGFVRYVMTDELNKDKKGTCGYRKAKDFDSSIVADPIDHLIKTLPVKNKTSQAIWLSITIPQNAAAGLYEGFVQIKKNGKVFAKLPYKLEVIDRTLPNPKDWSFHLDLWGNPYSVARFYNVKPWSREHFAALETEMKPYAEAGGKVITTSIMHKPWGGQTYDYFESMVTWTKKLDGSWQFDFDVFDKYVRFMMDLGINKQINCYSMVPWKLSFQYFDQATNSMQVINTKPGDKEYEEMWTAMLSAFSKHLKEKGWFEKTHISMDERPMDAMQKTLEVIKKADKNFKVSLAGAFHEELVNELDDYCVALRMKYKPADLIKRKTEGKVTTFYTSCEEPFPNTFTFSNPAESAWLGWYSAKENLDGFLRWAYNSWPARPLQDSRFTAWGAGDTYLVYPGGRSSIRFEKLIEGIQAYEKVRILKESFQKSGNRAGLEKINSILKDFDENQLKNIPADVFTEKAKNELNKL